MQALILAGGLGTRLKPYTDTMPKPMVPVLGKPFLEHQLRMLKSNGVDDVVISIGYLGEKIKEYFGDGERLNLKISYSVEETPVGTGGGLKKASALLKNEFFVIYGDSYLPIDYREVKRFFRSSGKKGLVVAFDNSIEDTTVPSNIAIEREAVTRYVKGLAESGLKYVEAGVLAFKKDFLGMIPDGVVSLEMDVFPKLIEKRELAGFITGQRFYDIGSPERLKIFEGYLNDNLKNAV